MNYVFLAILIILLSFSKSFSQRFVNIIISSFKNIIGEKKLGVSQNYVNEDKILEIGRKDQRLKKLLLMFQIINSPGLWLHNKMRLQCFCLSSNIIHCVVLQTPFFLPDRESSSWNAKEEKTER